MASWRLCGSLTVVRQQVNAKFPGRSKVSDGTIGDAAHQRQGRSSDHNAWYPPPAGGIVKGLDLTHDPRAGFSIGIFTDQLQAARPAWLKYAIANWMIMSGAPGPYPWVWRTYTGSDGHTSHAHLSAVDSPGCDSTTPLMIPMLSGTATTPTPVTNPGGGAPAPTTAPPFPLPAGFYFGPLTGPAESISGQYATDHQAWRDGLRRWQQRMRDRSWPLTADGYYGPQTANVTRQFQAQKGLTADGLIGPRTWAAAWTAPLS